MSSSNLTINSKVRLNNGVDMPIFGLGLIFVIISYLINFLLKLILKLIKACIWQIADLNGIKREDVFVVTKLFTTAVGKEGARAEIEDSLKLMDIGYIDQYLLHCPQGGKVLECYDVLLEYQKRGLIKTVGVSNFGVTHLEAMKNSGRPLPQVNQIELHPWCTSEDVVTWCRNNNVVLVG